MSGMRRLTGLITDQIEGDGFIAITLETGNEVIQLTSDRIVLTAWVSVILTGDNRLVSWLPASSLGSSVVSEET